MKKFLIIDDNKYDQYFLFKVLSDYCPCVVLTADNGQEGLDIIQQEVPDLVFLDVVMPDMDGIEMVEKLRTYCPLFDNPIIALTAATDQNKILRLISLGVNEYLVKPVNSESIYEVLHKTLEGSFN
jgi:CheY-like chemotaxis protein